MVSDHFYYVLWALAHAAYALIAQTRDVCLVMYNRLVRSVYVPRGDEFAKLKKIPQHVTVLLPSSLGTYSSNHLDVLVNLVLWSLATNISYVSFYDPLGVLVKKEEELMKRIEAKMDKSQRLIWHGATTTSKNGFSGPKVHVKLFITGRASLVDSCKELSHLDEALTVPIISNHQLKSYEFPDPQLAIYFGEYLNVCGYAPWQLRLVEFLNGGHFLEEFDERRFHAVLVRYGQCQQRVGK